MSRKQDAADQHRFEVLNRMLVDRHEEIRNKLRSLREVLPGEQTDVKDAEEQSMEDFVRGMDFVVMQMESETLRQIDEAIQRLEEGHYGVCGECGERIAEARLRALPFALLCRECQESAEDKRAAPIRPIVALDNDSTVWEPPQTRRATPRVIKSRTSIPPLSLGGQPKSARSRARA